jgi:hypothetical protein
MLDGNVIYQAYNNFIHNWELVQGFTKPKANLSIFSRDMFNIENQN